MIQGTRLKRVDQNMYIKPLGDLSMIGSQSKINWPHTMDMFHYQRVMMRNCENQSRLAVVMAAPIDVHD